MCKVCTEAVHCVALWTRVTLGLGMCKVCTEAVHCVALWTRVTLGWGMCPCQVCTEARDATKNAKKKSPKAKTRPGKKGTKARKGCVSGSANVPVCGYIYINMYIYIYTHVWCMYISLSNSWSSVQRISKGINLRLREAQGFLRNGTVDAGGESLSGDLLGPDLTDAGVKSVWGIQWGWRNIREKDWMVLPPLPSGLVHFFHPFLLKGATEQPGKEQAREAKKRIAGWPSASIGWEELMNLTGIEDDCWQLVKFPEFGAVCDIFTSYFVSSKVSELQRLGLSEVGFLVFEGRGSWDESNSHWTTCVETNIIYIYTCIYVYVHVHFVIYTCLRSLQKPSRVNQVM